MVNFEQLAANVLQRGGGRHPARHDVLGRHPRVRESRRRVRDIPAWHRGAFSGELGIQLATMLHMGAAVPNLSFAADAHYHHLEDDVIEGGKLKLTRVGAIRVPDAPGSGRASRQGQACQIRRAVSRARALSARSGPWPAGWLPPLVPNDRWADPMDDREPFVRRSVAIDVTVASVMQAERLACGLQSPRYATQWAV